MDSPIPRSFDFAPNGEPHVLEPTRRRNRVLFNWPKLQCGMRNSDVINYEYVITTSDGKKWEPGLMKNESCPNPSRQVTHRYTIKVRVVSPFGSGKYSQPKNVTFG